MTKSWLLISSVKGTFWKQKRFCCVLTSSDHGCKVIESDISVESTTGAVESDITDFFCSEKWCILQGELRLLVPLTLNHQAS